MSGRRGDREVVGRARMGASPMPHVVMAREFVPQLRPDAVVVQRFDNDLDENRYRHLLREPDGRVAELRDADLALLLAYVPHHREIVAGEVPASRAANPHYRLLSRLAAELDVPFLNGLALFGAPGRDPAAYYHPHDPHWNAAGHALFAEEVAARLRARSGVGAVSAP